MAKVERIKALRDKLKRLERSAGRHAGSVITGYTANYALYVHENKEARHAPGKQWKYLEQPARDLHNSGELAKLARQRVKAGGTLVEGLKIAALRIQAESQRIVPVSGWHPQISPPRQGSGNLKGSAFTKAE